MNEADQSRSAGLTAELAPVAGLLAQTVRDGAAGVPGAEECASLLDDWAEVAARDAAGRGGTPVGSFAERLGLEDLEHDLFLLAGLPEEHEALASVMRTLSPRHDPHLTVGLAARVLDGRRTEVNALLASGAAVRLGLLVLGHDGPFPERSITIADGIWWALHGFEAWPKGVHAIDLPHPPPGLDGWAADTEVQRVVETLQERRTTLVSVDATDLPVALSRCAALEVQAGVPLAACRIDPRDPELVRLATVHAVARDAIPVLVVDGTPPGGRASLQVDQLPAGPVVICAPPGSIALDTRRRILTLCLGPIDVAHRRTAWEEVLPDWPDLAPELAARHPVDPAHAAVVAQSVSDGEDHVVSAVGSAIRRRSAFDLPPGADLVESRTPWDRLVLDPDSTEQLRDVVTRVHHQATVLDDWGMLQAARGSRGVRLIFSGPPGTGKSLAAEVLAHELETSLLVVDVSRIVSKWIGETEKNLARVFDAAEASQCVLLLDEADALFGRRTTITDARDRYANIETAYLLQRIDHFSGLVVLTTNLLQNIDAAFLRRVDFVIDFRLPDLDARERLWALHLPDQLRSADVDLRRLAGTFPVPGAWIRGAAISAAYAAARRGTAVGHEHLAAAMRREYDKARKPYPERPPEPRGIPDDRAVRTLSGVQTAPTKEAP